MGVTKKRGKLSAVPEFVSHLRCEPPDLDGFVLITLIQEAFRLGIDLRSLLEARIHKAESELSKRAGWNQKRGPLREEQDNFLLLAFPRLDALRCMSREAENVGIRATTNADREGALFEAVVAAGSRCRDEHLRHLGRHVTTRPDEELLSDARWVISKHCQGATPKKLPQPLPESVPETLTPTQLWHERVRRRAEGMHPPPPPSDAAEATPLPFIPDHVELACERWRGECDSPSEMIEPKNWETNRRRYERLRAVLSGPPRDVGAVSEGAPFIRDWEAADAPGWVREVGSALFDGMDVSEEKQAAFNAWRRGEETR